MPIFLRVSRLRRRASAASGGLLCLLLVWQREVPSDAAVHGWLLPIAEAVLECQVAENAKPEIGAAGAESCNAVELKLEVARDSLR